MLDEGRKEDRREEEKKEEEEGERKRRGRKKIHNRKRTLKKEVLGEKRSKRLLKCSENGVCGDLEEAKRKQNQNKTRVR